MAADTKSLSVSVIVPVYNAARYVDKCVRSLFGQTYRKGEVTFIYFYDTTNAKSVVVTCEGPAEERKGVIYPVLVESKGPNPVEFENGYVAFEDLPDEKKRSIQTGVTDDDDLEDDEDEDQDTEEIYDEDQEDE